MSSTSKQTARSDGDNNWRRGGGGGDRSGGGSFARDRDDRGSGGGGDRSGGGSFARDRDDRGRDGNRDGNKGGGGNWRGEGKGFDRGDRGGGGDRAGGGNWRSGGGGRGDDRQGGDNRGGTGNNRGRGGGEGNRFSRNDGPSAAPSSGPDRQRLQLKQRTEPAASSTAESAGTANNASANKTSELQKMEILRPKHSSKEIAPVTEGTNIVTSDSEVATPVAEDTETDGAQDATGQLTAEKKEQKRREPEVLNSRAAALGGSSPDNKRESNTRREPREPRHDRGPPPVLNTRFDALAKEDNDKNNNDREDRQQDRGRGPPPVVTNSRFAKAAEADRATRTTTATTVALEDRGPPPVANSRFAKAADADRSSLREDNRGPPPVANSRFAKAAEADRSTRDENRGPPPSNSRFGPSEQDGGGRSSFSRGDDRGPPPIANSRFAAAALIAEGEKEQVDRERQQRFSNRGEDGNRRGDMRGSGPPLQQNSRFAAAAAADNDYVDRAERERRSKDMDRERGDRQGGGGGHRGSRFGGREEHELRREDLPRGPARYEEPQQQLSDRVEQLLKPKSRSADENIVIPPTKEHEANMLKIPAKPLNRDDDENILLPIKKKGTMDENKSSQKNEVPTEGRDVTAPINTVSTEKVEELLNEFVNGAKLGNELKEWCELNRSMLPAVEKIVFHLLTEKEKLNPDPECCWAETSKYGSALLYLVDDDLLNQMQVLWAIQLYCDTIGFPKLNDEAVVQSMFRAMYKFDLVGDEAFLEWKDDESDVHEKGKMNAIIQTVDWFNWLEQEEEEEEEEGGEEE